MEENKSPDSRKIRTLLILIYVLIGLGILFIIYSLLFNFGILGKIKTVLSSGGNKVGSAAENNISSSIAPISVDEAYNAYISGKDYIFLDVRSLDEYKSGHVDGAIHIPVSELIDRLDEIPKNKPVIAYCDGSTCGRSERAAEILLDNGFEEVYNMTGNGINEWKEKGYPTGAGE